MIKQNKNTELNIIDIFNDVSMCNELMKKYHTKTSIEAIGRYTLDTQSINSSLLESFWVLEALCEEAITSTQKLLTQNETRYRNTEGDQKEILKTTAILPLHNHKMELRNSIIWLKSKINEINYGIIPAEIILRLNWNGTRSQLYNGFNQLRKISTNKNIPYLSANDKDLNNFIDSRFLIKGVIPNNTPYKISWNSDKHDLTVIFKDMYSHNLINNTKDEIAQFIIESFSDYKLKSVKRYLDGSYIKKKYSLNVNIFN